MIIFKRFFFIIIFITLIPVITLSDDKIAFINLDNVVKKSNLGKNIIIYLETIDKKNIEFLKKNENILKEDEKKIKKKINIISKEELDKELNLLKEKLNDLNFKKNEMVKNYQKEKNSQLSDFFKKINPIIQKYMDDQTINVLLDKKNIYIGKSTSDITENIIKLINEKFE
jgi:Skp family chaperone for outer membrane proteins